MTDNNEKRLVTRQFATPLTEAEIAAVAGGDGENNGRNFGGTCTTGPDEDQ